MLKKISSLNPLIKSVIALGALIFLCISTLLFFLSTPLNLGTLNQKHTIKNVYAFENWNLTVGNLKLQFLGEGKVLTGYKNENINSILIKGEGFYGLEKSYFKTREEKEAKLPLSSSINKVYIPIESNSKLEELKGSVIFEPTSIKSNRKEEFKKLFRSYRQRTFDKLTLFGVERLFEPLRIQNVAFINAEDNKLVYQEGKNDFLYSINSGKYIEGAKNSQETNYNLKSLYTSTSFQLTIYYLLCILILTLVVYVLTAEIEKPNSQIVKDKNPISFLLMLSLPAITLFLSNLLENTRGAEEILIYITTAIIFILFFFYSKDTNFKLQLKETGLTTKNLGTSLIISLMVGFFGTLFGLLNFNLEGIDLSSPLYILKIFLIFGLIREWIIRGIFQNTLQKLLGPLKGLFLITFFFLIANSVALYFSYSFFYSTLYLEYLIFQPLIFLITGIIFQRLQNIIAPALFSSIIILLPQVLQF